MLGNARGPQLGGARGERARSKSDTDGLSPLPPNPLDLSAKMRPLSVGSKNAAGKIYTASSYTDRRALKVDGHLARFPNRRAVFSVFVSSGSRRG
jgi:hypothetical protein